MITSKMIRHYAQIVTLGELLSFTLASPFTWRSISKRKLQLTTGIHYLLFKVVGFVLLCVTLLISFRVFNSLYSSYLDFLGLMLYSCIASVLWIIIGLLQTVIKRREEIGDLVNGVIALDKKLKRVFPGAFIYAQKHLTRRRIHTENIFKLILCMHCTFNWVFVGTFYSRFDPVHRFFTDYIGLKPEINEFMYFPFAVAEGWFVYVMAYLIAIVISSTLFTLSMVMWFVSLEKILVSQQYSQRIGSVTQGQAYLRFLRCQQIVVQLTNTYAGSVAVSIHHLALLIAHILGNYALLRSMSSTSTDATIIKFAVATFLPVGYLVTYYEVLYLDRFTTEADRFLRTCRIQFRKNKILRRGFGAAQPIRIWTGYPFFCITSKRFFVLFVKLVVDQTINLVLTVGI